MRTTSAGRSVAVVARPGSPPTRASWSARRRDQQLEQEPALVGAQPFGQPREPARLAAVELRVAVGVVAHEHLGEVRVERLDVLGEVLAELEVELRLAGALDRHREREPVAARRAGDVGAELLVDQHGHRRPAARRRRPPRVEPVVDELP